MAGRLKRQKLSNPGKPQVAHHSRSDNGIVSAPADARRERVGIALLALAVVFTLVASWRKWPDPLVDFGRELYLPWRLSQGALLYRPIDHLYGPLYHYFNALSLR